MTDMAGSGVGLWDDDDKFYFESGRVSLRLRYPRTFQGP